MKNKNCIWIIIFIISFWSSIFLGGLSHAGNPEPSGTLTVAAISIPDIQDPIMLRVNFKPHLSLIFDNLVGMDHNGEISADMGLAHKWDTSPDKKMWTFYLRKGIKFHNGEELTADDVKYSLERFMLPKAVSSHTREIKNTIESIKVIDRYKVRIQCQKSAPLLDTLLSHMSTEGMVFPKEYIEEKGDEYFSLHPVGTGPYKVIEIKGGYSIKMEAAFDSHWLYGKPKYKYVVFRMVPEELVRIGMVKKGEADLAQITAERIKEVKESGLRVIFDPGASINFVTVHETWVKSNPVHDKKVRKALALAINGEEIHKYVYHGTGELTCSPVVSKAAIGYVERKPYPYDPQKAKELLKEAGYPNGFKVKLHSFTAEWFPALPGMMEIVASYFEAIGVKTEIVPYADYTTFRAKIVDHKAEGGVSGMEAGAKTNPLSSMYLFFHSKGVLHYAQVQELDEAMDKALSTLDNNERIELIKKADKYIYDNYLFLWALELAWPYAISDKLQIWDMGKLAFDINLPGVLMQNPVF